MIKIQIRVQNELVREVRGIPEDYMVEVLNYDIDGMRSTNWAKKTTTDCAEFRNGKRSTAASVQGRQWLLFRRRRHRRGRCLRESGGLTPNTVFPG